MAHRGLILRIGCPCLLIVGMLAAACGGGESTATPTPVVSPTATPPQQSVPTASPSPTPRPTATAAPTSTAGPAVKRGGILRTRTTNDPLPMDLLKQPITNTYPVFLPVLSSLILVNGSSVLGDLAETWNVSSDGRVISFNLLKGVSWHDGKPLTSSDLKVQLDKVFFGVGGYSSHLQGGFTAADHTEAPDPSTLKIVLKRPSNSFFTNMSNRLLVFYAPQVNDDDLTRGKVVGTGPFMWDSWEKGARITEKANPNFFRKGPQGQKLPYLDGIEFNLIVDVSAHVAAFRTGRLDLYDIGNWPALVGQVDTLKGAIPDLETGLTPATLWDALLLKNAPPFNDLRVRQALQYGIDRKLYVEAASLGLGVQTGFVMPGPQIGGRWGLPEAQEKQVPGLDPAKRAQDLAMAKDLLSQAGYGPAKPLKVTVHTASIGRQVEKTTVALGAMKEAGFQADLVPEENAVHTRRLVPGGDFQIIFRNLGLTIDDPSQMIGTFWTSNAPRNYGGWSDPEIDRMYDEQETTPDAAKRAVLIQDSVKRIYTQAYNLIIVWSRNPWVNRPTVKGWPAEPSLQNIGRHETTWLDR